MSQSIIDRKQRHFFIIKVLRRLMIALGVGLIGIMYLQSNESNMSIWWDVYTIAGDWFCVFFFFLLSPAFIIVLVRYFYRYGFQDRKVNFAVLHYFLILIVFIMLAFMHALSNGLTPLFG